ncbi:MAG TPA: alkyl sulfatase dimerization domain-containing protein [Solirubrobacterales bacterium]|nr:MBL fold metallo-hydrolase [Solirubrobacterales bacterium]HMW45008.1 alkyl sulfatase dimerization domain-containing protein [Solirubrobacterales bacterium]HMX71282.1 alkyl sulfatase dimerization domain-containing protein [Solirubrobacterales bacterium]HMY26336.1 alkyl sulfatase dimerization domain-containing protein [Solirubrobacterales bacterium]HNA24603.1 alkyl sulfatase dimerization domain-containing protein [Solirubrobacterales bacterium]
MSIDRKGASDFTREAHVHDIRCLDFEDNESFEEAKRGFIAPVPDGQILKDDGDFVFDPHRLAFASGDPEQPDTVNPSLWRQARLYADGGLFEVCDRIYQVRNLDISNITFIEGDTGLIVVDPLVSAEVAKAALDLYFEHRGEKEVVAVIHSHSHVDHFGGVRGVVDQADVDSGKVPIIAPEGFLEAAVSENVAAGNVMTRRAMYQFGILLPPDPQGTVGSGLGIGTSLGTITLIPPTDLITETGETRKIDGLTFEFMLTPDTEAPAEMHWYIPELRALTAAENCTHTLHNTYPIRGAIVRDPQAWSMYLNDTIDRWADKSDVMYAMHHWPVWGKDRVREMLEKGRDAYRYIHDETLRLANHGLTPREIAEQVEFPDSLAKHWSVRSYYGTVSHNVKSTYTRYLGWYDGNPANLEPLVPVESGKRYVEFMGGADNVVSKARESFEKGEYRWVAEVLGHVVFADPANQEARELQADAFEQLGYQTESSTWRNAYLMGAQELRHGTPSFPIGGTASEDSIRAMTLPMIFNFFAIKIHGVDAADLELDVNLDITDTGESAVLRLSNGVLSHSMTDRDEDAPVLEMSRELLNKLVGNEITLEEAVEAGEVESGPGLEVFRKFGEHLDEFDLWFPIIEP